MILEKISNLLYGETPVTSLRLENSSFARDAALKALASAHTKIVEDALYIERLERLNDKLLGVTEQELV